MTNSPWGKQSKALERSVSNNTGKIITEFFNYIFLFCYNLESVKKGYSLIFEGFVTKIWFDSLPKYSIQLFSSHWGHCRNPSWKLSTKISLCFKSNSRTNIFPYLLRQQVWIAIAFKFYIHEGRLVTRNMFFLYWGHKY